MMMMMIYTKPPPGNHTDIYTVIEFAKFIVRAVVGSLDFDFRVVSTTKS